MLPFQPSLRTERTRAHKLRQCHREVHIFNVKFTRPPLLTTSAILPWTDLLHAHWNADAALIRSRNSKISNGEKDINGLSLLTGSITRKRGQWIRDFSQSPEKTPGKHPETTSGCWICIFPSMPANSYYWTNFTGSHCELLSRSFLLIRSQHWGTPKSHLVFSNTI